MKPEIKACKQCKYFKQYDDRNYYDACKCLHPEIVVPSVIFGGYEAVEAYNARHEGKCGIEAKYWELNQS